MLAISIDRVGGNSVEPRREYSSEMADQCARTLPSMLNYECRSRLDNLMKEKLEILIITLEISTVKCKNFQFL